MGLNKSGGMPCLLEVCEVSELQSHWNEDPVFFCVGVVSVGPHSAWKADHIGSEAPVAMSMM